MRVVNGLFCLVLILFALVQYNDPDVLFWFLIYAAGAAWCGIAAARPRLLTGNGRLRGLFALCMIAAVFGTFHFWPSGMAWWTKQVIWDNEVVREGLGMAIMTIGLGLAGLTLWHGTRTKAV